MQCILSDIDNLDQHISTFLHHPDRYRPSQCPHCGKAGLWMHGVYYRQATCEKGVGCSAPIQRFLCPSCQHTCSVLPEYIPPRRWYHWAVQELALRLLIMGHSLMDVCRRLSVTLPNSRTPDISTLYRWRRQCRCQFRQQHSLLCSQYPELGHYAYYQTFWVACLDKMSLSKVMLSLHQAGLSIP